MLMLPQILVSTVPLLTDNELTSLGVETVGQRAELHKKCRDSMQSEFKHEMLVHHFGFMV